MRILIIEDDFSLQRALARKFQRLGHATCTAGSLTEARAQFDDSVDVVLTDINLGHENSRDFYLEFAAKFQAPDGPGLVVMTGGATPEEINFFRAHGYKVITKFEWLTLLQPAIEAAYKRKP